MKTQVRILISLIAGFAFLSGCSENSNPRSTDNRTGVNTAGNGKIAGRATNSPLTGVWKLYEKEPTQAELESAARAEKETLENPIDEDLAPKTDPEIAALLPNAIDAKHLIIGKDGSVVAAAPLEWLMSEGESFEKSEPVFLDFNSEYYVNGHGCDLDVHPENKLVATLIPRSKNEMILSLRCTHAGVLMSQLYTRVADTMAPAVRTQAEKEEKFRAVIRARIAKLNAVLENKQFELYSARAEGGKLKLNELSELMKSATTVSRPNEDGESVIENISFLSSSSGMALLNGIFINNYRVGLPPNWQRTPFQHLTTGEMYLYFHLVGAPDLPQPKKGEIVGFPGEAPRYTVLYNAEKKTLELTTVYELNETLGRATFTYQEVDAR